MMCHCGIKRHALFRAYLVKALIDIILITRSPIRDPVFPMTVPSHNSNPSIKYFDWVEEPTYGTDGITAENEINVKWSDANNEVYPDIDTLVGFFGEIAVVDVNLPEFLLDIVISKAKRCGSRT